MHRGRLLKARQFGRRQRTGQIGLRNRHVAGLIVGEVVFNGQILGVGICAWITAIAIEQRHRSDRCRRNTEKSKRKFLHVGKSP
jgi:hypothetical protein